jgi:hypothetical protein
MEGRRRRLVRSIAPFILFVICLYPGFIRKGSKAALPQTMRELFPSCARRAVRHRDIGASAVTGQGTER